MAQIVSLQILGTPKVAFTAARTFGFPVSSFIVSPVESGSSVPSGTQSVVTVSPTGLNQPPRVFFCSSTVAQVITAANA